MKKPELKIEEMQVWRTGRILDQIVQDMTSAVEVLNQLRERGYNKTFEAMGNVFVCREEHLCFHSSELQVDAVHKIDGIGYIYALHEPLCGIMGIFFFDGTV